MGEDSDVDKPRPVQVAPDIEENLEEAELENSGQWSPLPLEPEDYAGESPIPEEEDTQAVAAIREQVASTCCPYLISDYLPKLEV